MNDIFISYAREDKPWARRLADALEARGWSAWWDAEIPPGETWDEVIERELTTAKAVVVLWSATAVKKRWVKTEAALALDANKLLPVLIDEALPPLAFRPIQAVSLVDWRGGADHEGFVQLIGSIERLAGKPRQPAAGSGLADVSPPPPMPSPVVPRADDRRDDTRPAPGAENSGKAASRRRWPLIVGAGGAVAAAAIAGLMLLPGPSRTTGYSASVVNQKGEGYTASVTRSEPGAAAAPAALPATPSAAASGICRAIVNDPNPPLNVRSGPSTGQPVVGSVDNGAPVTIAERQGGWLRITAPVAGWVAGNLVGETCGDRSTGSDPARNAPGAPPGRYPLSSERLLTDADLAGLSADELRLMRNEIFARHGHVFNDPALRAYFSAQSWYRPANGNDAVQLSAIEQANVAKIRAFEQATAAAAR